MMVKRVSLERFIGFAGRLHPFSILYGKTGLRFIIGLLLLMPLGSAFSQTYEVTVYAMPTMYPLQWESPATLYKSTKKCFYKTIALEDTYLLGHMAIELRSTLLPKKLYLAMSAASKTERVDLILKQKIGLAIMGATLQGRIESEEHILHMLQVYAKRGKLAFITFRVKEAAMNQVLEFIRAFTSQRPNAFHPSDYYGGNYWPLYLGEGAGCSAFSLAVLASAGLLPPEADRWLMKVNIPMSLIGGEYNKNKKIPFHRILKTKKWSDGNGIPNVDFVCNQTYEPSILFQWILEKRLQPDSVYRPSELDGVPGLLVDCTDRTLPAEKPFFQERPQPNRFIDVYYQKIKKDVSKPTP